MSINRTLLERLRDPGPSDYRDLHVSENDLRESILGNLQNVLNTCQGNALIDNRYGLPHMSMIRSAMPHSVGGFEAAIRGTIERHEPRLTRVRVRHTPTADDPMALRFEISGVIQDEEGKFQVRFETFADDSGRLRVKG